MKFQLFCALIATLSSKAPRVDTDLENTLGKDIRIRLSHYSDFFLAFDPGSDRDFTITKDSKNADFRINRDGESFTITSHTNWTCVKSKKLSRCPNPSLFSLVSTDFGYLIKYKDKCLTVGHSIRFLDCNKGRRDQEFVFEAFLCDEKIQSVTSQMTPEAVQKARAKAEKKEDRKIEKQMDKYKIKSPEARKKLKKLWKSKGWSWPHFGLC